MSMTDYRLKSGRLFEFYVCVAPVFLLYGTQVPFTLYFKIRFWVLLQNLTHDLLAVDQLPFLWARSSRRCYLIPRPGCHVMCDVTMVPDKCDCRKVPYVLNGYMGRIVGSNSLFLQRRKVVKLLFYPKLPDFRKGTASLKVPRLHPFVILRMSMEHWWNDTARGKVEKSLSQCHVVYHKSHMDWSGIEPTKKKRGGGK